MERYSIKVRLPPAAWQTTGKPRWVTIGWATKNSKGISLQFDMLPLDCRKWDGTAMLFGENE